MVEPSSLGPYRLCGRLGVGGMGVVYRAEHVSTGVVYALKTLTLGTDAEATLRFQREGEAQARVDAHPSVARVHTLGLAEGRLYLVMDLLTGGDLADRLKAGPLDPREAAVVARDLALGLAHTHAAGVLHRDLKPANVLFDERGAPKLVDFGLAYLGGRESLTQTGTIMGTPAYMAPEQATAAARVGPTADVYGLGAILYAMLTGQAPFVGGSLYVILAAVLSDPPTPVSALRPGVDPVLEEICLRCLAKAPKERYASAAALAEALSAYLEGQAARRGSGGRGLLAAGVVAALATAIVAAVSVSGPTVSGPTEGEGDGSLDSRVLVDEGGASAEAERRLADYRAAVRAVASAATDGATQQAQAFAKTKALEVRDLPGGAVARAKVEAMEASSADWQARFRKAPDKTLSALLELVEGFPSVELRAGGAMEGALSGELDSIASSETDKDRAHALELFVEVRARGLAPTMALPPLARTLAERWASPMRAPAAALAVPAVRAVLRAGSWHLRLLDMSNAVSSGAFDSFSQAEPDLADLFATLRRSPGKRSTAEDARMARLTRALLDKDLTWLAPVYRAELRYHWVKLNPSRWEALDAEVLSDLSPLLVLGLTETLVGSWSRASNARSERFWKVALRQLSSWKPRNPGRQSEKRRQLLGCHALQASQAAMAEDLEAAQSHLALAEELAELTRPLDTNSRKRLVSARAFVADACGGPKEVWEKLGESGLRNLATLGGSRWRLAIEVARAVGQSDLALRYAQDPAVLIADPDRARLVAEIREEIGEEDR